MADIKTKGSIEKPKVKTSGFAPKKPHQLSRKNIKSSRNATHRARKTRCVMLPIK